MGIIALSLAAYGGAAPSGRFVIPAWVIIACAVAMGLGTMAGGSADHPHHGHPEMIDLKPNPRVRRRDRGGDQRS